MKATPEGASETGASYSEEPLSISVIIPVYNASLFLRACLEHFAKSTELPHECLVVDDGSTDDSVEVARQFCVSVLSTVAGGDRGVPVSAAARPGGLCLGSSCVMHALLGFALAPTRGALGLALAQTCASAIGLIVIVSSALIALHSASHRVPRTEAACLN
jgi:cellulose synthase/poly-beta-1,6-N-acetylglucosamine synthase-like glycosyltransferase